MKKILMIMVLASLVGCDWEPERTVNRMDFICDDSTVEKRADFTLKCISGANPKSDEEPEDWIRLCQKMAIENYCPAKSVMVLQYKECRDCWWQDSTVTVVKS